MVFVLKKRFVWFEVDVRSGQPRKAVRNDSSAKVNPKT